MPPVYSRFTCVDDCRWHSGSDPAGSTSPSAKPDGPRGGGGSRGAHHSDGERAQRPDHPEDRHHATGTGGGTHRGSSPDRPPGRLSNSSQRNTTHHVNKLCPPSLQNIGYPLHTTLRSINICKVGKVCHKPLNPGFHKTRIIPISRLIPRSRGLILRLS